jgi:hypothetical protein
MRSHLVQGAIGRLATLASLAVDELHRLIKHGTLADGMKFNAANAVLRYTLQGHGNEVLARQAENLRMQLEESKRDSGDGTNAAEQDSGGASDTDSQEGTDSRPAAEESGALDAEPNPRPVANESADEEDDIRPLFA